MAIPESQLETWSHQGACAQSRDTYAAVKRALEAQDAGYADKRFEVFLQGSYGNDTNIYSESDVDVVIRLESVFYHDLEALPSNEQAAFRAAHSDAVYSYSQYKEHVIKALEKSFGASVKSGPKAIKIGANGTRRDADVIVASQFRRYHRFMSLADQEYDLGICFFNDSGERISNYPKQHSENCTIKHQETDSWFKPTVRILKNLRGRLVSDGMIAQGIAPSYFVEGLLYNVPKNKFGTSYSAYFVEAINLILEADRSKFVCANKQYYLLGKSSVTWPTENCDKFLDGVKKLWANWR